MATVSHHAMRRYPIGPTDPTSNIGSTTQSYYVASPQRVTTAKSATTPQTTQDKSKKSWSQRLKLSKNEKVLPPLEADDYNINSASTLSKSMKYAESWLYGTVRGIPAPPMHGQPMFGPIPTEVAVMVCSCPEYLNGTKREMKKASICKKCKGSRLPLAPIGGTVRIRSNTAVVATMPRGSAGTVRMPNSKSSRPSILDSLHDPYDLMRRSRLVSPELQPVQLYDKRTRAKSSSPSRNRSRNKNRKRSPSPNENSINKSNRSRSASRIRPKNEECWLDDSEPERTGRRSILRCDVNPYDLLSTNSHINEFAPMNDDDNFDLELSLHSKKYENLLKTLNNHNIAAIAGQRVRVTGSRTPSVHDDNESLSYEHIEIRNLNKPKNDSKKVVLSSTPISTPTPTTPNTNHSHYDNLFDETLQQLNSLPKRPPRRKQDNNMEENESFKTSPKIDLALVTPTTLLHSISADGVSTPTNNNNNNNNNGGNHQCNTIKSILKRPMSLPPLLPSSMIISQSSTKSNDYNNLKLSIDAKLSDLQQHSTQKYKSKFQTDKITGGNTNVNIVNNINTLKINNSKHQQQHQQQQQREKEKQRISGSHFYLPLPARKKVQFLVENEIIDNNDDDDDLSEHNFDDSAQQKHGNNSVILNISENGSRVRSASDCSHVTIITPTFDSKNSVATAVGGIGSAGCNTVSVNDSIIVDNDDVSTTVKINSRTDADATTSSAADYGDVDDDVTLSKESNLCNVITYKTTSTDENFHLDNKHENNFITINGINDITGIDGINEKDNITEVTPICQRTSLHRSFSDRRIPSVQPINVMPQFNDTMALRQRCARGDARVLFSVGDDLPPRIRPRDPPPPPPPNNNSCLDESDKRCIDETTPMRPPRQIILRKYPPQDIVGDNNDTDGYEGSNSLEIPNVIVQNTNLDCDDHIYEDYYVNSSAAMNNKRETTDSHNANTQGNNDKYVEKLHIVNDVNVPAKKWQQSINEVYQGSRIFGSKTSMNNLNKTVVRVAPLVVNRESSAIHRLEIKHDDDDDTTMGQKKTSILISGDDCYSTVNVSDDTPIYQSSVVVNEVTASPGISNTSTNTVTICVSSPRTPEEELIYKNNKLNSLLSGAILKSIIPIGENERSSCSVLTPSRGTTFVNVDYDDVVRNDLITEKAEEIKAALAEEELGRLLRDPVEAVRRNLVPHVCGKINDPTASVSASSTSTDVVLRQKNSVDNNTSDNTPKKINEKNSFIAKLLEDPTLGHLADGLENDLVAKLIENSLMRLKENRSNLDLSGTRDEENMSKLIDISLQKVQEERQRLENMKQHTLITTSKTPPPSPTPPATLTPLSLPDTPQLTVQPTDQKETSDQKQPSNRDSMSSGNSYGSANYEMYEFDNGGDLSDCYHSCSSELTTEDESNSTRSKFYQMLVDATLSEIEISTTADDDHHYESIRLNGDPIYEEINDVPPPLPLSPPPNTCSDSDLDKKNNRSIFEGASKYDILSYLVDAKERGIVQEESYAYNFSNTSDIIIEEEGEKLSELHQRQSSDLSSRISHLSNASDSSEETSLPTIANDKLIAHRKSSAEIERNDSGVGSETSKTSRSKFQSSPVSIIDKNSPIHLCEDCDGPVETQVTDSGVMYAPLVCRKCGKKRAERKEIITEVVETEEKYGRDLQIILEEFYQPMLVAGLLSQEQLSAIFLNTEELLENNQALAERMRDALDIAMEQGDDDLLTVNVGKLFIEAAPMLHAFENYCIRQAAASLLLANLEKEKELLRIFLRVSQMENTVLRRMNLNSFLMVPVQRVTKYPLLLARLFKVTPPQQEGRNALKQAQEKIELHLNHMNREAKDVPTKLWRRISSSSPGRRTSCEIDMINIKLRKMAVDVLEWNHDEVRFAIEGKLLFTQPTDNNWRKGRTIKLTPVNALLVTNGKPSPNYKADRALCDPLNFPRHTGIREASLLLVKEKCGRYTLFREPLYLDRCIVCTEADWDDYFEVQEISTKDTFIFKAEDGGRTKQWYSQLQYHAQGMGAWRKRRNALANIMINGMMMRS